MEAFKYTYDDLFNPTLQALHSLGGSASIAEIEEEVAKILNLSDDEVNDIHRGSISKLSYRLAWSRNYLKRYGLLENSARGVWALTTSGQNISSIDKEEVKRQVKSIDLQSRTVESKGEEEKEETPYEEVPNIAWQEAVLNILHNMPPDKFERLSQRMLRELGFLNVEVTGKTGDGGIDGKGIVKLGGVLSFHVVFQCKRFKGSVSPSYIRDFRGAMIGRADKGLFITTGTFTREAKKEAQRDGAPPIDLVDGFQFAEKLKELGIGIDVSNIENVEINKDWFDSF